MLKPTSGLLWSNARATLSLCRGCLEPAKVYAGADLSLHQGCFETPTALSWADLSLYQGCFETVTAYIRVKLIYIYFYISILKYLKMLIILKNYKINNDLFLDQTFIIYSNAKIVSQ